MESLKPSANLRNIDKLTALWALSESGLGGILHAFQIPFSGFFLAAFAILVIRLIAFYSKNPLKSILKATFLVLLIKAAVSPQSPPMAYLAVAFQGFSGAIIFQIVKKQSLATSLHAIFSMMETALQKLLVLWIFFGTSFVKAFDDFSKEVFKNLNLSIDSFSTWIIVIYLLAYFIWALYVAYLSINVPNNLSRRQLKFEADVQIQAKRLEVKRRKYFKKMIAPLFIISAIYLIAVLTHSEILWRSFYRTLFILFVWWLITPLIRSALIWWLSKQRENHRKDFSNIFILLSKTQNQIKPALAMAKKDAKGIKVYKEFVFNLLALSLREDD